jgi:CDP-2,3-bis-(O-geranylgeranyl)-sn-glycerol synthase
MLEIKLILLLLAANGAPLIAYDLLKQRWAYPVDGGLRLPDGRRLLGGSCTWRGWLVSAVVTAATAALLGLTAATGLLMALLAMAGDTLSSFIKRRLGRPPGSMALGLDQIPEALFPLLGVRGQFALQIPDITLLVAVFMVLELLLSRILYKLRLRKQPY